MGRNAQPLIPPAEMFTIIGLMAKTNKQNQKKKKQATYQHTVATVPRKCSYVAPGGADLRECKHSDGSVLQWWRRTCTSFSQWRRLGEEERVCEERRRNH